MHPSISWFNAAKNPANRQWFQDRNGPLPSLFPLPDAQGLAYVTSAEEATWWNFTFLLSITAHQRNDRPELDYWSLINGLSRYQSSVTLGFEAPPLASSRSTEICRNVANAHHLPTAVSYIMRCMPRVIAIYSSELTMGWRNGCIRWQIASIIDYKPSANWLRWRTKRSSLIDR